MIVIRLAKPNIHGEPGIRLPDAELVEAAGDRREVIGGFGVVDADAHRGHVHGQLLGNVELLRAADADVGVRDPGAVLQVPRKRLVVAEDGSAGASVERGNVRVPTHRVPVSVVAIRLNEGAAVRLRQDHEFPRRGGGHRHLALGVDGVVGCRSPRRGKSQNRYCDTQQASAQT